MSFYFEGGVKSFVRFLNRNRKVLHDPIYVQKEVDRIGVEVAMQYTEGVAISGMPLPIPSIHRMAAHI